MKNLNINKHTGLVSTIFAIILVSISACKKEYPDYPYNDITGFVITDANGKNLTAAIQGTDIIIYWPPFQEIPDSITPQIAVADRAVVTPASGTKVAFQEGVVYSVKAQNGATKTYQLKPVINQPLPYGKVGTSATIMVDNLETVVLGQAVGITGDYFIPDLEQTKLYLLSRKSEETLVNEEVAQITNSRIVLKNTVFSDTGYHRFKLVTGVRTVITDPFMVIYSQPIVPASNEEVSVKVGETLLIKGSYVDKSEITAVRLFDDQSGQQIPLDIVSVDADGAVVKITEAVSPGRYYYLLMDYNYYGKQFDGLEIYFSNLTITP